MISKLIVWDHDRHAALRRLELALENYAIAGLTTNIPFLLRLARHPEFKKGHVSTAFIPKFKDDLLFPEPPPVPPQAFVLAVLAQLLWEQAAVVAHQRTSEDAWSAWALKADAFRPNGHLQERRQYKSGARTYDAEITHVGEAAYAITVSEGGHSSTFNRVTGEFKQGQLRATLDAQKVKAIVVETAGGHVQVLHGGLQHLLAPIAQTTAAIKAQALGSLLSPMPAEIVKVLVKDGDSVKQGQLVMLLEAMKMLTEVRAPREGTVKAVYFQPGQLVAQKGLPLLLIE